MRYWLGERGTPRLTPSGVVSVLKRFGFLLAGQAGSHQKWRNPQTGKQVIVANHSGRTILLGTMRAIISGSGIPPENWVG